MKYIFWTFLIIVIAAVVAFYGFLHFTGKNMSMGKEALMEMFNTYRPQKVIQSFFEYRDLKVEGNEGNILEVATGEEIVDMTQQDEVQVLGKIIPGVKATSRISVPATFRYHIDLKGNWEMIEDGNRLHVIAPPLQPSLPVAFDTSKMTKNNEGIMKFVIGDNMVALERTITPSLEKRAKDKEQIKRFHDEARQSIAKFLHTWLVGEGQWDQGKIEQIIVYFDGEIVDIDDKLKRPQMQVDQTAF